MKQTGCVFILPLFLKARAGGSTGDSQHHTQPPCSLMDDRPPLGSWNRLVTRRVLTFHSSTVPSTLHEYTRLEAEAHFILALETAVRTVIRKRAEWPCKQTGTHSARGTGRGSNVTGYAAKGV